MALAIRMRVAHYLNGSACPVQLASFPADRRSAWELSCQWNGTKQQSKKEKSWQIQKQVIRAQSCLIHTNESPCGDSSPSWKAMLYMTLTDWRPPVLQTLSILIAILSTCGSCISLNIMKWNESWKFLIAWRTLLTSFQMNWILCLNKIKATLTIPACNIN